MKASQNFPRPVEKVLVNRIPGVPENQRVRLVFQDPSPVVRVIWGAVANSAANAYALTGAERELCERRARAAVGSRHEDIRVALSDVMNVVAARKKG